MSVYNQGDPRQKIQCCNSCGTPTGRCEEDTLQVGESGPLCEACYPIAKINALNAELTRLRAVNAELVKACEGMLSLTHCLYDGPSWPRFEQSQSEITAAHAALAHAKETT